LKFTEFKKKTEILQNFEFSIYAVSDKHQSGQPHTAIVRMPR